jgi:hypothetical protein
MEEKNERDKIIQLSEQRFKAPSSKRGSDMVTIVDEDGEVNLLVPQIKQSLALLLKGVYW